MGILGADGSLRDTIIGLSFYFIDIELKNIQSKPYLLPAA
jgi:hypothetical protein